MKSTEEMVFEGYILKCRECDSEVCRKHEKGCSYYDLEGFSWYHKKNKSWYVGEALFG